MGRYINLTVHPLSVAEISKNFSDDIEYIANPKNIRKDEFDALINFGGFAEVYLKGTTRFYRIWSRRIYWLLKSKFMRQESTIRLIYLNYYSIK